MRVGAVAKPNRRRLDGVQGDEERYDERGREHHRELEERPLGLVLGYVALWHVATVPVECSRTSTSPLRMSAFGTLQTSMPTPSMRALGGEVDIPDARSGVR